MDVIFEMISKRICWDHVRHCQLYSGRDPNDLKLQFFPTVYVKKDVKIRLVLNTLPLHPTVVTVQSPLFLPPPDI